MNDNDDPSGRPGGIPTARPNGGIASRPDGGAAGSAGGGAAGGQDRGLAGRPDGGAASSAGGFIAGGRSADRPGNRGLGLIALLTVIIGVLALTAAAFVFAYAGVHEIALSAGVPAGLARFYPALPDAVLVVACAAALALRNARWWSRWFASLAILVIVALVGTADAVHAMAIKLPRQPTAAAVAVFPWALLLLGLQLWLSVLRHTRLTQVSSGSPDRVPTGRLAGSAPPRTLAKTGAGTQKSTPPVASDTELHSAPPGIVGAAEAGSSRARPADATSQPRGLDLVLPPYREEPDGGDSAPELAIDAEPEPDDPASGDEADITLASGGYHYSAAPFGAGEPTLGTEPGYAAIPPILGAPVPEPEPRENDHPEPSHPEPSHPEPSHAESSDPEPSHAESSRPEPSHAESSDPVMRSPARRSQSGRKLTSLVSERPIHRSQHGRRSRRAHLGGTHGSPRRRPISSASAAHLCRLVSRRSNPAAATRGGTVEGLHRSGENVDGGTVEGLHRSRENRGGPLQVAGEPWRASTGRGRT